MAEGAGAGIDMPGMDPDMDGAGRVPAGGITIPGIAADDEGAVDGLGLLGPISMPGMLIDMLFMACMRFVSEST